MAARFFSQYHYAVPYWLARAAPVASPRLLLQIDQDYVVFSHPLDVAVHDGVMNLHEAMLLQGSVWSRVEVHLEESRFTLSTLREGPVALQRPMVEGNQTRNFITDRTLMQLKTYGGGVSPDVMKNESVGQWRTAGGAPSRCGRFDGRCTAPGDGSCVIATFIVRNGVTTTSSQGIFI